MMRLFVFILACSISSGLLAQEPEKYSFKTVKECAATEVKDQGKTGTCWAFSGSSLIESELMRLGITDVDASEIYIVRCIYQAKAENYVRRQGNARLTEGGLAHDVFMAIMKHGMMPQKAYPGKQKGAYDHSNIEPELKKLCDEILASGKSGRLATAWQKRIEAYLNEQFGEVPKEFSYNDKKYSAQSYAVALGIEPQDFVTLTSFTHHPFYQSFVLEIPDNFSNGLYYNLPLNEMMRCINSAVQNGYTVSWDADVSNKGFAAKHGIAIVPKIDWEAKNDVQKTNTFKYRETEKSITQELRQELFDLQETQDDHLMHITGIVSESNTSGIFYRVKNSWGEISDLKGYFHASEAYLRLNTIGVTLHKSALPVDVRRRLGLEEGSVNIENSTPQNTGANQPINERAKMKASRLTKAAPASDIKSKE
jgi:bleomycin hydrolase